MKDTPSEAGARKRLTFFRRVRIVQQRAMYGPAVGRHTLVVVAAGQPLLKSCAGFKQNGIFHLRLGTDSGPRKSGAIAMTGL